jgi:hypothetical protein
MSKAVVNVQLTLDGVMHGEPTPRPPAARDQHERREPGTDEVAAGR